MRKLPLILLLLLPPTIAQQARAEDEVKPAAAGNTAATDIATPAPKAKAGDEPFTPPPGWRQKQRGKFIVYCSRQTEKGTRFTKEVCYDEEGIRAMLVAQREDRERTDQMRRVCSAQKACGAN